MRTILGVAAHQDIDQIQQIRGHDRRVLRLSDQELRLTQLPDQISFVDDDCLLEGLEGPERGLTALRREVTAVIEQLVEDVIRRYEFHVAGRDAREDPCRRS
ncbi:MAG: hypothetical protein ABEJ92_05810 [Halobacteriales archaeon]